MEKDNVIKIPDRSHLLIVRKELDQLGFSLESIMPYATTLTGGRSLKGAMNFREHTENALIDYSFNLKRDKSGELRLKDYSGLIRRTSFYIPHVILKGIDSWLLDKDMWALDWRKHPGHFFDKPLGNDDITYRAMKDAATKNNIFMSAIDSLPLEAQSHANEDWEQLMVKHYSNTPIESAIRETVPYLNRSLETELMFTNVTTVEEARRTLYH